MTKFFRRKITKDQSRDTGMAMVLLLLIVFAIAGSGTVTCLVRWCCMC